MAPNLKKYKLSLRKEFSYACAYCGIREPELGGSQSFHIDHYKPKSKFPDLEAEYSNMLYACRNCNQYKGDYWPSIMQKMLQMIILNPRIENIDNHINKIDLNWTGGTAQGKWNIERLRLNSKFRLERRKNRINVEMVISKLKENRIVLQAKQASISGRVSELEQDIFELESMINNLEKSITGSMD